MSKSHKLTIKQKQNYEVGYGHYDYAGGKTTFDNRPKRQRTRQSQKRQAFKDYE